MVAPGVAATPTSSPEFGLWNNLMSRGLLVDELLNTQPVRSFDVRVANVQGDLLLIQDDHTVFELDEVGALIWQQCDGHHSVEAIAEVVAERYAVALDRATRDTKSFVQALASEELVVLDSSR